MSTTFFGDELLELDEALAMIPGPLPSRMTIHRWRRDGVGPARVKFPAFAIGKRLLVRASDLRRFIGALSETTVHPDRPFALEA